MGLLDQLSQRSQRLSDDFSAYSDGDINGAQVVLRTAGETAGGINDAIGTVVEPLVPKIVEDGLAYIARGAMNTGPAKVAAKWMEDNPEQARDVMSALNVGSLIGTKGIGSSLTSAAKGGTGLNLRQI